jgi:hypothetical protein
MATYLASLSTGDFIASLAGVLSLFLLGSLFAFLTSPFAIHPRASFDSFGGLTNVVLARNYTQLSDRLNSGGPADIWNAIRTIVVEQLGVVPESVTPSARFVEDLAMD